AGGDAHAQRAAAGRRQPHLAREHDVDEIHLHLRVQVAAAERHPEAAREAAGLPGARAAEATEAAEPAEPAEPGEQLLEVDLLAERFRHRRAPAPLGPAPEGARLLGVEARLETLDAELVV